MLECVMIVSADGGNLHTLAQVGVLRSEGSYFARVRRLSQSLLLKVLSALIQWVICSLPPPLDGIYVYRKEGVSSFLLDHVITGDGNLPPAHAISVF